MADLNKKNLQIFMENCEELNAVFYENLKLMEDNREWITGKISDFINEKFDIEPKSVTTSDRCTFITVNTGLTKLDNVDTNVFSDLGLACDFIAGFNSDIILKLHFEGKKE